MKSLLNFARNLIEKASYIELIETEPNGYSILFKDPDEHSDDLKGILNDMLGVWKQRGLTLSDEEGRLYFDVDHKAFAKYQEDTKKDLNDKITKNSDGTITVDLDPWEFSCMPKQMEPLMPIMQHLTNVQNQSWTTLIGLFLTEPDFVKNELSHSDRVSARWIIRGRSPMGEDHYYEVHDVKGGDTGQLYAVDGYGVNALFEWFDEHFKDVKPVAYARSFVISDGETGTFGINAKGEKWHSWNKIPTWLREIGWE